MKKFLIFIQIKMDVAIFFNFFTKFYNSAIINFFYNIKSILLEKNMLIFNIIQKLNIKMNI